MTIELNAAALCEKVATATKHNNELREATIHGDWAKLSRVLDRRLSEAFGEVETGDDGERDAVDTPEP